MSADLGEILKAVPLAFAILGEVYILTSVAIASAMTIYENRVYKSKLKRGDVQAGYYKPAGFRRNLNWIFPELINSRD